MSKTNTISATLLALALGAASFGAQAAEPTGFYAGVGVGQAMIDEGPIDEDDTAYQVFGGYQATRHFGFELGYTDFGEIEDSINGVDGRLEADTVSLTAVGTLPFTSNFSGYGRVGFHHWDAEAELGGVRADADGTDPVYGLGVQYRFNDSLALRGEYSRFEMDDVDVDLAQVQLRYDF